MYSAPLGNGVLPMESSYDDFESDDEVDDVVDVNKRMFESAHNGQESIVRQMLRRGADYESTLEAAAPEGHETIVRLMLDLGVRDINSAMAYGAYSDMRPL